MRSAWTWVIAVSALLASLLVAVLWGPESIGFSAVLGAIGDRLSGRPPADEGVDAIVWLIRMPRALLAGLVGAGLAVVGVAMQALVRNPLAEPYILGLSSGASAGASIYYLGFLPVWMGQTISLPLSAFLGGLATITVVFLIARSGNIVSVARLLLAGVAMSALMASVTSFVIFSSPSPDKIRVVLFWLLGSLSAAQWSSLPVPAIVTLGALVVLWSASRSMDALLLGEEPAFNLGIAVEPLKRILIAVAALVTGVLVAASGTIGFVGLLVPHGVRAITGVNHRRVLPLSFVTGATFLVLADLAARTILRPGELPVGVLTAILGVPFFLVLLRKTEYQFG